MVENESTTNIAISTVVEIIGVSATIKTGGQSTNTMSYFSLAIVITSFILCESSSSEGLGGMGPLVTTSIPFTFVFCTTESNVAVLSER